MTRGLRIRKSGRVVFDSTLAVGGVCLAIVAITGTASVYSFPAFSTGHTPIVLFSDGAVRSTWQYDEVLGYPRFTFPATAVAPNTRTSAGIFLK